MDCRPPLEPCHVEDCAGLDEVKALLPPGQLWQLDRESVYTQYIRALGDIKTEWNRRICQEWQESNPCTARRLLDYWGDFYNFPSCALVLDAANLCGWIALVRNPACQPGSLGFLQAVVDFIWPPVDIGDGVFAPQVEVAVNHADIFSFNGVPGSRCADLNAIVITAPPEFYRYELLRDEVIADFFDPQDGINGCRRYFIPEIDCLRKCVFPLGLSVGYKTYPQDGDNGADIYGVPDDARALREPPFIVCGDCITEVSTAPTPTPPDGI